MDKAKVYFTKEISPDAIIKLYDKLGILLKGNVAAKLHSGEDGNQNYVKPEFVKPIIDKLNATVVETNTAYGERWNSGKRDTTESHLKVIEKHGWNKYFNVDILDAEGEVIIPIENGFVLKENRIGSHMDNYNSMIILSHFKGHPEGGYGGALKQLSIGCASSSGKAMIHSAGQSADRLKCWDYPRPQDSFLESMADAASSIVKKYKDNIAYINMMVNLSVDCDCCSIAEDPCMKDIGILASLDPVAIDRACIDLILNSDDPCRAHFIERVNSKNGIHTIDIANKLGIGSIDYELISID